MARWSHSLLTAELVDHGVLRSIDGPWWHIKPNPQWGGTDGYGLEYQRTEFAVHCSPAVWAVGSKTPGGTLTTSPRTRCSAGRVPCQARRRQPTANAPHNGGNAVAQSAGSSWCSGARRPKLGARVPCSRSSPGCGVLPANTPRGAHTNAGCSMTRDMCRAPLRAASLERPSVPTRLSY